MLRILHLEDDGNDRELVADILRADGIVCVIQAVAARGAFEAALADPPDLILADMTLPGFDGVAAQQIAAAACAGVPFIYVSGSMGEENAVERFRSGATDYVLKHRLEKLPAAVRRAMREQENRRQRERAEEGLRQLNAELAARVGTRTRELTETNQALIVAQREAERANRAKSDFLSRMSHDLRTPLNAVMGFAQVLELDELTPGQKNAVTQILRGGRHLLGLINEVLDIARIEAGRLSLSPEPTAIDQVVEHAIDLIRPLAGQRALTVDVAPIPHGYVFADRQRLNEILFNLLSNAVKDNRYAGKIVVAVHPGVERTAVSVRDTGAGIPAEKFALLFTPFERLGANQSGIEGTGLGLALAKGLAEAMAGSITVESVVDEGTTFRLELPTCAAPASAGEVAEPAAAPSGHAAGVLLYIEDNVSNVQLMQQLLLLRPGVELVHAATGHDGLKLVRERMPALVFLDLHLPDLPGDEVLRHIWEDPVTRPIPVAVLTADATPGQKRRLLASGAAAYLTKPFDIREVLRLVDRAIGPGPERGGRVVTRPPGKIVVVDDVEANLELIVGLLERDGYVVHSAVNGALALDLVLREQPDVVLTDVVMPTMNGFELCRRIKDDRETRLIPVVLVTGLAEREDRLEGIAAGADDFLSKPFDAHELRARVRSLVRLKRFTDELDSADSVILSLGLTVEARDRYTSGHCERMSRFAGAFGVYLELGDEEVAALHRGGYLHDVGKVGLPDAVLLKSGPLVAAERILMEQHPVIGEGLCGNLRLLKLVRPIVRWHHERLDGSGYPDRLHGDQIPLLAQIMGIVDVFDALTTDRVYRQRLSMEAACVELQQEAARGWRSPGLVDQFIALCRAGGIQLHHT